MLRRAILKSALAAAVACTFNHPAAAHTPYKQWQVYRKKHLLVGCLKDTPRTYTLAKSLVELFAVALPRASARIARAPHSHRIASLMATDQLDTSIVPSSIAAEIASGTGVYAAYGPVPLRLLFRFDDLFYVGLKSMPDHHAVLIHQALSSEYTGDRTDKSVVPWHEGIVEHRS